MHIFITGATGFIGPVIVELAVKQGHTVHGLSRSPKGDELLTSLGAVPIRGDLAAHDILREQSAKADATLHLAFDHDFSKPYDEIIKLDTEAVDALAGPLVGTSKPLIVTSGLLSVRPDPDGGVVDESAPYTDNTRVKRHVCEKHALSWAERGVRVNVLRLPPYVYGRANETGFAAKMVKMAVDNGVSGYIASVKDFCVSSVYVDDAAALFLLLASDKTVKPGEIFHVTGDWNTTYGMLAGAIGGSVGVPVRAFEREEAEERWGEFLSRFFGLVIRASNGKAVERLGWKPSGPRLVEELETGSYRQVAERFKQMKE